MAPADNSIDQKIEFYVYGEALGGAEAYSDMQTLVVGCPSDVFVASETSQTFSATIDASSGTV